MKTRLKSTVAKVRTVEFGRSQSGSRYLHPLTFIEWILLAVLLAAFVYRGFLPAWRTLNTDFPDYYLAASLYRRHIPLDRVYDWTWFQRQKDFLGIEQPLVGFAPHPPMCALPIVPLSILSPLAAKRVWLVLNLGFLLLALELMHRVTKLRRRRIAVVALLCAVPLRANFLFGQYYVLILLLICAAYYSSWLNHRLTSGMLLAAAASLKLFPALFLILFVRRRDWRSAAGLMIGTAVLATISVAVFGLEVHWVYLIEVLPRAIRGDLLGPYSLQWSSFTALWHHLFLFEPELNPSPVLNSSVLCALAEAVTATILLFGFLLSANDDGAQTTKALEWASFALLILLLSSMPSSYHYCVLIFVAVIGVDALMTRTDPLNAIILLSLFGIACAPLPNIGHLLSTRLLGTLALYFLLLRALISGKKFHLSATSLAAGTLVGALLTISTVDSLQNRGEDFQRRLANIPLGYRSGNPVVMDGQVIFTEMVDEGYRAVAFQDGGVHYLPWPEDVLSLAGSEHSPVGYFEQVGGQPLIARVPIVSSSSSVQYIGKGQQPVMSPDGRWLAFVREQNGRSAVWLCEADCERGLQEIVQNIPGLLEMSVTSEGDLIAAVGPVSEPYLALARRAPHTIAPMEGVTRPARYPAISPDGKLLAFSRREGGSWHLFVHTLATGQEQQLTHAACNATSPAWEDARTLLYATDCGRGLGLTAIARISVPN